MSQVQEQWSKSLQCHESGAKEFYVEHKTPWWSKINESWQSCTIRYGKHNGADDGTVGYTKKG